MTRIEPEVLERFSSALIRSHGAPERTADDIAASLVAADLRGHGSHGVRKLPEKYFPEIEKGQIEPTAEPTVRRDESLSAVVDGQRAYGQIVGQRAVDVSVEKAKANGVGVVGIRNVSHIGRIGEWVERATGKETAFIALVCNPGGQMVAPPGSADRRLSTNPMGFGVPTYGSLPFSLVLDIATSQVAYGKIREWDTKGKPLPREWAVDSEGKSITDPERVLEGEGAVRPLGGQTTGHKGFGLAVMSELLASLISGDSISGEDEKGNIAAFITFDPKAFTSPTDFEKRIEVFADYLRETTHFPEVRTGPTTRTGRSLLPGEFEYVTAQKRRNLGIPLDQNVRSMLRESAIGHDVKIPDALGP